VTLGEAGAANGIRQEIVRCLPALRRFASSLCGSRADAEDLVQASIERALRAQEQWREGTRLDSWLFRIAQNLWRDQRRATRDRTVELDEAVDLEGEDGRETVAQRSELRAFETAFAQLPPDHQSVLALVVLHGASYLEAARALGVPKGTIMSRLARARAALAMKMAERQR
jgi:RNA polymerase sigma-70 factor (ECF subfamily)